MAPRRRLPLNVEKTPAGGFRARTTVNGKNVRGPSRKTPLEAEDDARQLHKNTLRRGRADTLDEAFDLVLVECKRRRRRPGTIEFYEQWRDQIQDQFGKHRRVSGIREEDVQRWVDSLLDRGNSPGTVRAKLRVLRRLVWLRAISFPLRESPHLLAHEREL